MLFSDDELDRLREHIGRCVADRLLDHDGAGASIIDRAALLQLARPVLRIQACLQDASGCPDVERAGRMVSHVVDLSGIATPCRRASSPEARTGLKRKRDHSSLQRIDTTIAVTTRANSSSNTSSIVPCAGPITPPQDADGADPHPAAATVLDAQEESSSLAGHQQQQRRAISGLRPAPPGAVDMAEPDSQRQIHSGDKFPKRRKQQPDKHVLQPSTLDKLIRGIWEQIHGSLGLEPQNFVELLESKPLECDEEEGEEGESRLAPGCLAPVSPAASCVGGEGGGGGGGGGGRPRIHDSSSSSSSSSSSHSSFKQHNMFCSRVTQASRACRSLEVIVQARWVERFDAYVDAQTAADATAPRSRHNKAALSEACADFGWTEKELRNKMSIWRGYSRIRAAGGWAALVFAGMGIYRFCKYQLGLEREGSMLHQRLRALRPALEVAADTLHPRWRRLLAAVGESPERVYAGHPHDYVVRLDGAPPLPLSRTYLQWDPHFTFRHLDECVVDERAWGGDDPRGTARGGDTACDTCGGRQSDDAARNACACFAGLFGAARPPLPAPVMVFRTADGRNNGLLALCAFERGAPVGEFVGLVTKGLSDEDVMESRAASGTHYQIWQGRQGNFTRFVNHSCKANAQYQRFSWLGTQRIVLVSKGIAAGAEITVDYSDKYWRGLDKTCLCGESCCRYRRE